MTKLFASLGTFVLVWATSIAVMIYGWGLTPRSWPWIIVGGLAVWILSALHVLGESSRND